ncbi:MAG: porin [Deltaproteobacteria bacterium]|nr:porin [Deltaproteobacteria bacterium]
MTPPVASTNTPASGPASAPPAPAPAASSGNPVAPYRLQMSGGYTSLALGGSAPSYSGGMFQTTVGQNFNLDSRNSLFLNGVFRLGALNDGSGHDVSLVHFGLEGGYEGWIAPGWLSAFVFAGIGSNILYSQQAGVAPSITRALDNQSMLALSLGGGLTFARGIVVLSGGFQPNFGLSVPETPDSFGGRGYNPMGYFFMAGLDLARLVDVAGGHFPRDVSMGQFVRGITPGLYLDTTYTANLGAPSTGMNAMRIFDTRADRPMFNYLELSLDRAVDADNPFGFRFDFGVGENPRVARARSSFSGDWYDLQQVYARLRLPIGNGVTLRGGKFATLIGTEVIESLSNNHISHSWQFGLAEPFTHLGVLAEYPIITDSSGASLFTATTGIINGWDNVLDRSAGIGWLGALSGNPTPWLTLSGASTVGSEGGRLRSILDFIAAVKVNDATSTAGGFDRFTASATYDWGHEGQGAGQPEANWHALGLTARVGLIPQVSFAQGFEVFLDPDAARTGTAQTMWSTRSTFQVTPFASINSPWARALRVRAEFRHDSSTNPSFLSGSLPSTSQNTFGLQLGYMY